MCTHVYRHVCRHAHRHTQVGAQPLESSRRDGQKGCRAGPHTSAGHAVGDAGAPPTRGMDATLGLDGGAEGCGQGARDLVDVEAGARIYFWQLFRGTPTAHAGGRPSGNVLGSKAPPDRYGSTAIAVGVLRDFSKKKCALGRRRSGCARPPPWLRKPADIRIDAHPGASINVCRLPVQWGRTGRPPQKKKLCMHARTDTYDHLGMRIEIHK